MCVTTLSHANATINLDFCHIDRFTYTGSVYHHTFGYSYLLGKQYETGHVFRTIKPHLYNNDTQYMYCYSLQHSYTCMLHLCKTTIGLNVSLRPYSHTCSRSTAWYLLVRHHITTVIPQPFHT